MVYKISINEYVKNSDFGLVDPDKIEMVDGISNKYFSHPGVEGVPIEVPLGVNYENGKRFLADQTGKTFELKDYSADNFLYVLGGKCPSGYEEIDSTYIKLYEDNFCRDFTLSPFIGGGILTAAGLLFLTNAKDVTDQTKSMIFVPGLLGAVVGLVSGMVCNYAYPDSHHAIWDELKTCLADERIIGEGPIPEESF